MSMFTLVTGQAGSGKLHWIEKDVEQYVIKYDRCVYMLPLKGFEIKSAKQVELIRLGNTRKPGVYEVNIGDTFDKSELIHKHFPKLKNCLIVIPASPTYLELINLALSLKDTNDVDVTLIRETIKDLPKITSIIPDSFKIHADNTLQISKVYVSELAEQIGKENAMCFMIAQWCVNSQQAFNLKEKDEIFHLGFYLVMEEAKMITKSENPDYVAYLREMILTEGTEMVKKRFELTIPDEEIREDMLVYID